jgi:hypothetical protein
MKLYFQGDLCIESVDDAALDVARVVPHARDGALVLAEGEESGHRHAFYDGGVALFHFGALAQDVPDDLYIGHLRIDADAAELRHEEHDTITLPKGLYRVRRQREYGGSDLVDPPGQRSFDSALSRLVED